MNEVSRHALMKTLEQLEHDEYVLSLDIDAERRILSEKEEMLKKRNHETKMIKQELGIIEDGSKLIYTTEIFGKDGPWMNSPEELRSVIKDMYFESDDKEFKECGISEIELRGMIASCWAISEGDKLEITKPGVEFTVIVSLERVPLDELNREFTGF